MDCALTCIFVLVVSMFTARSFEFIQKYQYSPNNLVTDLMNLSNRMFLFTNYKLRDVFSFPNFRRSPKPKWAPCGPFHPNFDTLAADKQIMCKHARFKDVFVSRSMSLTQKRDYFNP